MNTVSALTAVPWSGVSAPVSVRRVPARPESASGSAGRQVLGWAADQKLVETRSAAKAVIVALFDLNTAEFTRVLQQVPKSCQVSPLLQQVPKPCQVSPLPRLRAM